ncbi:uncharacterized protein LOC132930687 isoform X2 [Rhopalosiphum padi]|uniref:uncharacterized protein LOC132930687 isoform X2 n=1 Tax=Rhopalosiphum padi TaxID=40932 RepID=UPI00298DCE6E|nr:uncharacterized protein LOC132930687 isoform X2 [Rhopalosiphum padi]XP_060852672.1 uncharacterized protein LOC132930687 isoform X2 [Rhopalosiphum padi]
MTDACLTGLYDTQKNPTVITTPTPLNNYSNGTLTPTQIELGQSSCRYSGNHHPNDTACYVDAFEISKLPTNECTSYIYDGITCTDDSKIVPNYSPDDLKNIKSLTNFSSKVFLFYGRLNLSIWTSENFNDSIETEAQNLKEFLDEYPVVGLILTGINYPVLTDNFYIEFQSYVACIKNKNPKIKIGLYLRASTMTYIKNETEWFDFSKLNDIMDFYLITFNYFNDCSEELYNGGTTPLHSDNPNIITLEEFGASLNVSKIAKEKVYLEFMITPTTIIFDERNYLHCEISFDQYCKTDIKSKWCADNETTFYEKGVFARQYAAGWVGRDIDLVDRGGSCGCNGDQFISFHMILDAYNNKTMRTCDFKKG